MVTMNGLNILSRYLTTMTAEMASTAGLLAGDSSKNGQLTEIGGSDRR
jgi:hypothetical protein